MRNTTLCYLERDGSLLMLFRNKKAVDENHGKWIGVGGKFEEGETPEECAVREVYEETGLKVGSLRLRGIITFVMQPLTTEYMFYIPVTTSQVSCPTRTAARKASCAGWKKKNWMNCRCGKATGFFCGC